MNNQQPFNFTKNSKHSVEPHSSVLFSWSTTGSYREPDDSSPHASIPCKINFNIMLPSTLKPS
jgi:hypothetical protein